MILLANERVVPLAMITMYGMKVVRNNIAAVTEPVVADENNEEVM